MKTSAPFLTVLFTCAVFSSTEAALTWTGAGDAISLYQEANWLEDDGSALEANEINGNTAVTADTGGEIRIEGGAGSPSNYGGNFNIGNNHLFVTGKTLQSTTSGIVGATGAAMTVGTGGTVNVAGTITGFNSGGGITVSGGTLNSSGELNVSGTFLNVSNGGTVNTDIIRLLGGSSIWSGGSVTINDPNGFRTAGAVSLSNSFNITAAAGDFTVTHTDLSGGYTNRDIAGKLLIGFFSLDGVFVDPDDNGFTGGLSSEADVVSLNNFLKTNYTVNGKYFELSDNTGGQRTLSVVAVPEPSSIAFLALGSLAVLRRRRK